MDGSQFMSSMLSKAKAATEKAKTAAITAAHATKNFAIDAGEKIKREAQVNIIGASPALALVGQEIMIKGRPLKIESLLAEGGFASVYLASLPNGDKIVVKKMFAGNAETVNQLTNEVKLMSSFSHPNIVRVLASESRKEGSGVEIMVAMEFCPGGHLLSRINKQSETGKPLPYEKLLEVFSNLVKPVAYLHSQQPSPITHRDLKFENVLIAADGTLKLCDFGSASTFRGFINTRDERNAQEDAITRFTTPHFRSPEMVDLYSGLPLDERSDVWALGCMLFGLAYFKHPFQDAGPLAILAGRYRIPYAPAYPPPVVTMIRQCLQIRPQDRPTAAQLLAYTEACLRLAQETKSQEGPYPLLQTSSGGQVAASPLPPPPPQATLYDGTLAPPLSYFEVGHDTPAASSSGKTTSGDDGFGDFGGSGGGSLSADRSSSSSSSSSSATAAEPSPTAAAGSAKPRGPAQPSLHHETAAEILAKLSSAPTAASQSSSNLQARLARSRGGGGAGGAGGVSSNSLLSTTASPAPSPAMPTPSPAVARPAATSSVSSASNGGAGARRPSGGGGGAGGAGAAADFDLDFAAFGVTAVNSPPASAHPSASSNSGAGAKADFDDFEAFGSSSSSSASSTVDDSLANGFAGSATISDDTQQQQHKRIASGVGFGRPSQPAQQEQASQASSSSSSSSASVLDDLFSPPPPAATERKPSASAIDVASLYSAGPGAARQQQQQQQQQHQARPSGSGGGFDAFAAFGAAPAPVPAPAATTNTNKVTSADDFFNAF